VRKITLVYFTALALVFLYALDNFNPHEIESDYYQNYMAALNLYQRHAFSISTETEKQIPFLYREPGYPFFLSLCWKFIFPKGVPSFEKLIPKKTENWERSHRLLYANFLILGLVLCLSAWITYEISGLWWAGLIPLVFIGGTDAWIKSLSEYQSEPFTGLLMLFAGWMLMRASSDKAKEWHFFLLGLGVAFLTLTRALFLYSMVPILCVALRRKRRFILKSIFLYSIPLFVLVGGWMIRNHRVSGRYFLSERGGFVLYERTYFQDLSVGQLGRDLLEWTPLPVSSMIFTALFHVEPDHSSSAYKFANDKKLTLQRSLPSSAMADAAMRELALRRFLGNPLKEIFLTIIFTYRGIFVWGFWESLIFVLLAVIYSRTLWKSNPRDEWALYFPAIFSFLSCAFLTTNLPRYHVAIVPFFMIALSCLLVKISGHYRFSSLRSCLIDRPIAKNFYRCS
jgi:hypothetical protein